MTCPKSARRGSPVSGLTTLLSTPKPDQYPYHILNVGIRRLKKSTETATAITSHVQSAAATTSKARK